MAMAHKIENYLMYIDCWKSTVEYHHVYFECANLEKIVFVKKCVINCQGHQKKLHRKNMLWYDNLCAKYRIKIFMQLTGC